MHHPSNNLAHHKKNNRRHFSTGRTYTWPRLLYQRIDNLICDICLVSENLTRIRSRHIIDCCDLPLYPKLCLLYDSLNDILVDPIKIHHWAHPKYTMLSSLYYLPTRWYALKFASNMILKMIYVLIREKITTDPPQKDDDQLLIKEMPPQVMCTLNSKCFLLQAQSRHY